MPVYQPPPKPARQFNEIPFGPDDAFPGVTEADIEREGIEFAPGVRLPLPLSPVEGSRHDTVVRPDAVVPAEGSLSSLDAVVPGQPPPRHSSKTTDLSSKTPVELTYERASTSSLASIEIVQFARAHGRNGKLGRPEMRTWTLRLALERGLLQPFVITVTPLPETVTGPARTSFDGFIYLLQCKWLDTPDVPSPWDDRVRGGVVWHHELGGKGGAARAGRAGCVGLVCVATQGPPDEAVAALGVCGVREDYQRKGRRYAAEGRLRIRALDEQAGVVSAECRGDGAVWKVGYDGRGWWCSCPARGRCSHLFALGLVVAMKRPERRVEARPDSEAEPEA